MKTYNEMAEDVFRIGDEKIIKAKSKRKKTAAVISAVFAAAIAVTAWQVSLNDSKKPETINQNTETTQATTADNSTAAPTTDSSQKFDAAAPSVSPDDSKSGSTTDICVPLYGGKDSTGGSGGIFIPIFPQKEGIKYTGEKLTDEEAKEYFSKNRQSIISSLSASGVAADSIQIKEKGYCHAMYSGLENEQLEVRQNFRDYLVYNGEELVSIVTLVKESGEIYSSPAFGANWFNDYNKFLNSHKGEELVYVYANQMEFIVTPDGKVENPLGSFNADEYFQGVTNLYERLYCPEIVYVP